MKTKKEILSLFGIGIILLLSNISIPLQASPFSVDKIETTTNDSVMTVKELYDEFKKDEVAATEKYAGKKVAIKGIAVKVGPDRYTYPGVELSEKKNGTTRALCVLPYTDYLKLRKVSKGDEVTMRGEVRQFLGKMDMIIIKQCVLQEK